MPWGKKKEVPIVFDSVVGGLSEVYKKKLLPLEKDYDFHRLCQMTELGPADFTCKPMVLLVGQYSTGKTTFIKYLLEGEFPGMRIGPEPTTDGFNVIMWAKDDRKIPGNAAVNDATKPFQPLGAFGNSFLNRFHVAETNNRVLENLTLIDTPGILSGAKQEIDRGYPFTKVLEWFAQRVDRIILLFDAHKLDISDEFRRSIEALHGYDEKIRIVLNKSDMISTQQLMRVYGALMWSLGKVIKTPEVTRVYIGSYWDQPMQIDDNRKLFELEENDLFTDLQGLPKNAALRKLNDLIKRARLAKVNAYICDSLRSEMPKMFGKDKKKDELIKNLPDTFMKIQKLYSLSPEDFPSIDKMREILPLLDFSSFKILKPKDIETVDSMMADDIARLMAMIPTEADQQKNDDSVKGGVFGGDESREFNPFEKGVAEGFNKHKHNNGWAPTHDRSYGDWKRMHAELLEQNNISDGKIPGPTAKDALIKSKLGKQHLGKLWTLADIDADGKLDEDEWCLIQYLIKIKLEWPEVVPPQKLNGHEHLVPESKKTLVFGKH